MAALARIHGARADPPATDVQRFLERNAQWLCDGTVAKRPRWSDDALVLIVETTQCRTGTVWHARTGTIEVRVPLTRDTLADVPAVQRGATIRWWGRVRHAVRFCNPGTWQLGWRRVEAGIALTATVRTPQYVSVLAPPPRGWRTWIESRAAAGMAQLAALCGSSAPVPPVLAVRGDPVCGVLAALLFGDGDAVPDASWAAYRTTGLVHLLVVSGLHIVLVGWGVWWSLRAIVVRSGWWMRCRGIEWVTCAISLGALWSYVALVGEQVPALRSAVMVTVWLIGEPLRRRADALSTLAAVAIGVLLYNPWALWSVSFQLSFLAVLGLIVASPLLRRMAPWPAWRRWPTEAAATAFVASCATMPVLAYHFQQIAWLGFFANILAVPFVTAILMPLGFCWWILATVAVVAPVMVGAMQWCGYLLYRATAWFHRATTALDAAPWATPIVYAPTAAELCCAVALMLTTAALLAGWRLRTPIRRRAALGVVCAALCWCVAARDMLPGQRAPLRLTLLDVGQGSSAVLQTPDGRALLIDAGGIAGTDFPIGALIVTPALRALGVRRLEAVVLSHYHPDHYGGLADVVEAWKPRTLYVNGSWGNAASPGWNAVAVRLSATGVTWHPLQRGAVVWSDAGVTIRALHPAGTETFEALHENDRSLVLDVRYSAQRWWLPGDIEAAAEAQLLAAGEHGPLDLLVAPHHGSATSSTAALLEQMRPTHAAISCGQWNRYRFPKPDVLARYAAIGSRVLRTDRDGAVQLVTHGAVGDLQWEISTSPIQSRADSLLLMPQQ